VQVGAGKVDLAPFEIDGLGNAETVPRHDQDERCIALAPRPLRAALLNGFVDPPKQPIPSPVAKGAGLVVARSFVTHSCVRNCERHRRGARAAGKDLMHTVG
jgi:hypothetical protein